MKAFHSYFPSIKDDNDKYGVDLYLENAIDQRLYITPSQSREPNNQYLIFYKRRIFITLKKNFANNLSNIIERFK